MVRQVRQRKAKRGRIGHHTGDTMLPILSGSTFFDRSCRACTTMYNVLNILFAVLSLVGSARSHCQSGAMYIEYFQAMVKILYWVLM